MSRSINYWWDFVWVPDMIIKIETNDPKCPGYLEQFTPQTVEEADKIVKDLREGRLTYKRK